MQRVLALGGWAAAIEPDWGARAVYPPNAGEARLLELAIAARRYGWPDVLLGRKLFALFRQAGFLPVRVLAAATCQTADDVPSQDIASQGVASEVMGNNLAQLIAQSRSFLLEHSLISAPELDAALDDLARLPHERDFLLASLEFTALGEKSAPPLAGPGERLE
jgi:hypothetical protein